MVLENLIFQELIPRAEVYLQLARFMFTFAVGILLTRFVLIPLVDRATRNRSSSKKVVHQFHNVVLISGIILSLLAGLQAGEFGNLVTIIGTIAAALTVAIGFGMRDEVANYVVGTTIHLSSPFVKGDYVTVAEQEGEVKEITLRSTVLNGHSSDRISIPNSKVGTNSVKNHTRGIKTKSSVVMKSSPEEAEELSELLKEVAVENEDVLESPSPETVYRDYVDEKLEFGVRYWVKDTSSPKKIKSDVMKEFNRRAVERGLLKEDEEEESEEEKPQESTE